MPPTKQTYRVILRSPADVARAHAIIDNAQVGTETPYEVTVKPYELTRSQAQNRLYRKWLSIICEETGQDTESLHIVFKERFLVPLLCAADDKLAERVQAVKQLRRDGAHKMADFAKGILLDYASTTSLKVRGMTTYLDNVSVFAAELGITLSQPE